LPEIDGFEILKQMKEDNMLAETPVIVLSNLTGEDDIEKALWFGAKDYLIKTKFEPKDIVVKVKEFLASPQ
jgi:DNA-binding response OmpR family regulator